MGRSGPHCNPSPGEGGGGRRAKHPRLSSGELLVPIEGSNQALGWNSLWRVVVLYLRVTYLFPCVQGFACTYVWSPHMQCPQKPEEGLLQLEPWTIVGSQCSHHLSHSSRPCFCFSYYLLLHLTGSINSRPQESAELRPLTSGLFKDLQSLRIHLPPASCLWAQRFPLHQVQVGSKLYQQAHEGRLTTMAQDSIHDTPGGAPVEFLCVDRAIAIEVRICPSLQEEPEALKVMVGSTDVQRADHQGGKPPWERGPGVRSQVMVDINIRPIPTGREK